MSKRNNKNNYAAKLAAKNTSTAQNNSGKKMEARYAPTIIPKTISRTRADIAVWQAAIKQAGNADNAKRTKLIQLYNDIANDALLTSQIQNRMLNTLGSSFTITDDNGKENEEITNLLQSAKWFGNIVQSILEANYFGYSLIELSNDGTKIICTTLPRENIEPTKGLFYPDYSADKFITYREVAEYGTWLLEFNSKELGIYNKAIPHVLFKRFAQSCWSELCEIYGIPPRYLKTNTQDPAMLDRAEQMLRDMGSAAWFIIDETESFEFANGVSTTGDVYKNLIQLCNNENSLLISGAVVGQDTEHGNRSKEDSSIQMLNHLIAADKMQVQQYMNETVLPALFNMGLIPQGLQMLYKQAEDKEALWKKVIEVLPHKDVDDTFIKDNFGIDVLPKKQTQTLSADFFTEGLG